MRMFRLALACLLISTITMPGLAQPRLEKPNPILAVGGVEGLVYLPFAVAWRLGYFSQEGLTVDVQNFGGGGLALRALVGGSADVVSGFYDHTVQMQAQGRRIKAVVMQQRYPGLVLAIARHAAEGGIRSLLDLRGKKIGVTAPGSSTHFFVNFLMTREGVSLDDISIIGVGAGATAVAAVRNKAVDAVSNVDPTITTLQSAGDIPLVLADTRTTRGTLRVFGGPYPAGCLYATEEFIQQNPNTIQALVNATVRALQWIRTHKAEEIVDAMPPEYYQGNKEVYTHAVRSMLESYSLDGRISPAGPPNVLGVLGQFDPNVRKAAGSINVGETYDMRFVERFWQQHQ